jgi:hypothetical protein
MNSDAGGAHGEQAFGIGAEVVDGVAGVIETLEGLCGFDVGICRFHAI